MSSSADQPGTTPAYAGEDKDKSQPQSQTYRQIAASHIDTLSRINEQLPKLLTYFAATISQLTNNPIETPVSKDKPDTIQSRQEALWMMSLFTSASIKEIREELIMQINDLERYGVIPEKHQRYTPLPREGQATKTVDPETTVTNGGFGNFDVGILNARAASGHAGEEDVLDRLKTLTEELIRRSGGEVNEEEMVVDG